MKRKLLGFAVLLLVLVAAYRPSGANDPTPPPPFQVIEEEPKPPQPQEELQDLKDGWNEPSNGGDRIV